MSLNRYYFGLIKVVLRYKKMSSFPFYDIMMKDTKTSDLTVKQKNEFLSKMLLMDKSGYELIYALIRVYEINNEDLPSSFKLPYSGKFVEKDMHFDLEKLPLKLRQVLYKFVNVHLEKMEEERNKQLLSNTSAVLASEARANQNN